MEHKYRMKLDMRVLQHLGIKLYSNVSAVLSELVANAWDADSTEVNINFDIDRDRILLRDNGNGMTVDEINARFLTVGYDKRKEEGKVSEVFARDFMGRKGIGKLSVFSIAQEVEVFSAKKGEKNALRIVLKNLEDAITKGDEYHPEEIEYPDDYPEKGTTLVLSHLVKKRVGLTISALRKRLARRFAVIGVKKSDAEYFDVKVNGNLVGLNDRDDFRSLEYLWEFGQQATIDPRHTPRVAQRFLLKEDSIPGNPTWRVTGWFGTAHKPTDLETEEAGSLKNIVVLARGRLIQEGILEKLGFNRIFGSYVTGQIQADFLDLDGEDDIATSDRQRLVEDDPRVIALREFLRKALLDASDTWSDVRRKKKGEDAENEHPKLKEWVEGLPDAQRGPARNLLGLIEGLPLDEDREPDRRELFRSGVLAFERLRLKEAAHQLENLKTLDSEQLLPLLVNQDYYEAALYRDIVRSRVEAIRKFKDLTDKKAKEKVLQTHLFQHLWLLDAGWERATGSETMEHNLKRDFPKEFGEDLSDEESKGRIDIKYRTNAGVHIIVELKKYERIVTIDELEQQGRAYRSALIKLLDKSGEKNPNVQLVFVLGTPVSIPTDAGLPDDYLEQRLKLLQGRVVFYDRLIQNALAAYGDYLDAQDKVDRVEQVLKGL